MASVGDISVDISLDISALRNNLQRVERDLEEMQREFKNTSQVADKEAGNIASAFAGILAGVGGAGILAGLSGIVGDILNTTSEIESSAGQYEQVMGKLAGNSDKYIDAMSEKWNKHPSELKNAMMQYQAILKGKGVSEEEAFEMSKTMLERTVDANAFANEDMASTTDRFMAMIKGEYDSLDTAMINLSAGMMNDKAQEVYGKKFDELSVSQQEQLKIQEAIRQHTSAGVFGQGERESESYANHVANLTKTFDELKATLGSPNIETAIDVLSDLTVVLEDVAKWFSGLPKPVQEFAVVVGIASVASVGLALALGGVAFALGAIATALGVSIGMVAGIVALAVVVVVAVVSLVYLIIKYWDEIKAYTIKLWKNIVKFTEKLWKSMKETAVKIWDSMKTYFSELWTKISEGVKGFLQNIGDWFTEKWESISTKTSEIFSAITDFIVEWGLKLFSLTPIGMFVNMIVDNWDFIKESTSLIFQMISDMIKIIWDEIVAYVSPIITSHAEFIVACWESLKSWTLKIFDGIKAFLVGIWQAIVGFIVPIVTKIWEGIKEKWDAISKFTRELFGKVSTFLTEIWGEMKKAVVNKATEIWEEVKQKFDDVKKSITEPIEEAKETISGLIDDIKGFFTDLKLKIPLPSVPKFSVKAGTSTFLGKEITVPKFDISWNAKGNIFNGASLLGGGQGVGEAGAEVVMPISHKRYMKPYASMVAELMSDMDSGKSSNGNVVNNFEIAQLVVREEADIEKIAISLEKKQRQQARAKGTMSFA